MNLDDILDYLLSNGLNGTESREEEILFYDNILWNLEYGFTSETFDTSNIENGIDQILKTEKLTITFSTTKNQKNNINKDMTTIDLGECEILLRKFYNISDNEPLYMKKIDVIQDGMKAMKIEYHKSWNKSSNIIKFYEWTFISWFIVWCLCEIIREKFNKFKFNNMR